MGRFKDGGSAQCRQSRLRQISVASANASASSTSTPRYRTVFSILVCPSRIWIHEGFRSLCR